MTAVLVTVRFADTRNVRQVERVATSVNVVLAGECWTFLNRSHHSTQTRTGLQAYDVIASQHPLVGPE